MKNKILSTVLSAVFAAAMVCSLASCGGEAETKPVGDVNQSQAQQEAESQEAESQEAVSQEVQSQETESKQPSQDDVIAATIEETVMWDDEHIKVTALSLTSDQYYHILNLRIDNKTGTDLYVMASRTAVNSFVVEPTLSVDVPANGSAEGQFRVWQKDVKAGVVADIETRFSYSSDDYSVNSKTKRVKIETSAAASFDYSYDESGTVLYDENGIKIICKGFNNEGNPMIYLSSTGELSEGCCVEAYEVYVNGKKSYSDYYAWVFTNTRNLAEMELDDEDVDGNELGEVESLKVSFKISRENLADSRAVKTELVEIPVE